MAASSQPEDWQLVAGTGYAVKASKSEITLLYSHSTQRLLSFWQTLGHNICASHHV
jgi:hypothetical protein